MRLLSLSLAVLLVASSASAAPADSTKPTVDVQLFHPVAGGTGFFTVESGELNPHFGINAGLALNYAHKPLQVKVLRADGSQEPIGIVVENRADASVIASIGLWGWGEFGFAMPFIMQGGLEKDKFDGAGIDVGASSLDGFTQGDLRLIPKVKVVDIDEGTFAAAIIGTVIVPSAGGAPYAGEAGVVYAPSLALSSRSTLMRFAVDIGYRMREKTEIQVYEDDSAPGLVIDDEIFAKMAVAFDLNMGEGTPFELVGEIFGHTPQDNPLALNSSGGVNRDLQEPRTVLEGDLGIRTMLLDDFLFTLGGGGGFLPGYGAPAPRVFASISFYTGKAGPPDQDQDGIPDEIDQCIDRKEDIDTFEDEDGCPDLDNDKDRVLDEDDQCPLEPEDKDGFQDEDGCPDPDNDGDGIADADDKCPVEAEDKDSFEDEDGCPDLDNDGDGVADTVDQCPLEAEDIDGFQDSDGCPDLDNDGDGLSDLTDLCPNRAEDKDNVADDDGCPEDNDGDGIPDAEDKCPNQAETYNGIDDSDGCPEKLRSQSLVKVTQEKIEIKKKVFFKTGSDVIQSRSFPLLDQVAAVLRNYKTILKVRVEGHTDSRGSAKRNRELSLSRAQAVVVYLVGQGIDVSRLEAVGFGPDKPIASNRSARGREMNRRVEFMIAEQRQYGDSVAEPAVEMNIETPAAEPQAAPPAAPAPAGQPLIEMEIEAVPKGKGKKKK